LNVLHIITLYNYIKHNPTADIVPRTVIFAGKSAPGYAMAKLIIKLITSVAEIVNTDPDIGDRLKVVFLPNYNVSMGQRIFPAADISEQISTAGTEASGTSNMKFAMNGALTIGTLDGANIELRDQVGIDNFFLFGLTAAQVAQTKVWVYRPWDYYNANTELRTAIDQIASGYFSQGDTTLFQPLIESLKNQDDYRVFADYQAYIDAQKQVSQVYRHQEQWVRQSILNTARSGYFSSDRAIREYAQDIWHLNPVPVMLDAPPR
jgi:starch phosphorylase